MNEPRTDLGWMSLLASTLYACDERGRLVASRMGGDASVPRLLVGLAREGLCWRLRADLPETGVRELARLLGAERPLEPGSEPPSERVGRLPERLATLRERLASHAPIERERIAMACRLGPVGADAGSEGVVELGPDDAERVVELLPHDLPLPGCLPAFAAVASERLVSLAWCVTQAGDGEEPAGVLAGLATLPGFEGLGLEAGVLSAWVRAQRERGACPLGLIPGADSGCPSPFEAFGTILRID